MRSPLKIVKLVRAGWRLVKDPNRLDEVIAMADDVGDNATIDAVVDHVRKSPGGAAALADRPRVTIDLPRLRGLPEGTLGREFARFIDDRQLNPDDLPHRPADEARSWVRAHLYESHDAWHVATGFDTDVAGEAGLQAFYLAQFPARLAAVLLSIVFLNTFLYRFDDKDARMDAIARGWQLGKAARLLIGVRWDDLWAVPLGEVRGRLGLPGDGAALRAVA